MSIPWGRGRAEVIKLVNVYRPPETPGSPADGGNTERLCNLLRSLRGRVVVLGDSNLPNTDWSQGWSTIAGERMVVEAVGDMFWHQLVKEPTHSLGNTLDLCLTSSLELVAGLEVIAPLGNIDHKGIEVNIVGRGADVSTKEEVRFEREEVSRKLKNIKASGAPGPDKVGSRVLHDMVEILATPLTIIFNRLMEEGGVPAI